MKQHSYYAFRWGNIGFAMMDLPHSVLSPFMAWGGDQQHLLRGTFDNGIIDSMSWGFGYHGEHSAQAAFLRDVSTSLPTDLRFVVSHGVASGVELFPDGEFPDGKPRVHIDDVKRLANRAHELGFDMSLAGHQQERLGYTLLTAVGQPAIPVTSFQRGSGTNVWPYSSPPFAGVFGWRPPGAHPVTGAHHGSSEGNPGFATYEARAGHVRIAHWFSRHETNEEHTQSGTTFHSGGFRCQECGLYQRGRWNGAGAQERDFRIYFRDESCMFRRIDGAQVDQAEEWLSVCTREEMEPTP